MPRLVDDSDDSDDDDKENHNDEDEDDIDKDMPSIFSDDEDDTKDDNDCYVTDDHCHLHEGTDGTEHVETTMPATEGMAQMQKLLFLHCCLSHLNFRDLRQLLKLPIHGPNPGCATCSQVKVKAWSAPKKSLKRASFIVQRIHLDTFFARGLKPWQAFAAEFSGSP